jgi:hypothetical protein
VSWLGRLFGRGEKEATDGTPRRRTVDKDGGLYVYVRCQGCGEEIQGRINPSSDLSRAEDGRGYFVRKVLIGQQCFRPIELQLRYADMNGSLLSYDVTGGDWIETRT